MRNSTKSRCAVALLLVAVTSAVVQAQQCQPDKIKQLLKEIVACQEQSDPPQAPQKPMGPRGMAFPGRPVYPAGPGGYPNVPSSGPGSPEELDFFNRGGSTFFSSPPSAGGAPEGIGILVSRPIPADVRPISGGGDGPTDPQVFVASPRYRPGSFPFGGPGGFSFGGPPRRGGPPQGSGPSDSPQSETPTGSFFPSLFGGSGYPSTDERFGGPPSFGSPFGGGPSDGNPFTFEITPSDGTGKDSNPLGIDFDEIIRLLKELQGKTGDEEEGDVTKNPDLDANTTEPIVDVDTTIAPTTEESATQSTPTTTVPMETTEKPVK